MVMCPATTKATVGRRKLVVSWLELLHCVYFECLVPIFKSSMFLASVVLQQGATAAKVEKQAAQACQKHTAHMKAY